MANLEWLIERCRRELTFSYVRGSGPGGQNVNKVATAVQLRFDVRRSPSLPESSRHRFAQIAGSRLTATGTLVIEARRYRTQAQNKEDALQRFEAILRRSAEVQKPRHHTNPSKASRERRMQSKKMRGEIKQSRRSSETD
jgi:ribosome-associated protein